MQSKGKTDSDYEGRVRNFLLTLTEADLNRSFWPWSYHRTGGESYYGYAITCKGDTKNIFYIFFTM